MKRVQMTESGRAHLATHPVQGVLFDMDGVIIDTERLYTRFWVEAGRMMGFPMELEHGLALRALNHAKAQELFHEWFGPTAIHGEIRKKREEIMSKYIEEHGVDAKPGIRELLEYLKEKKIPFCIATASPVERARGHLSRIGLNDYFEHIVTGYDVKVGKPEPDIYLAAAAKIGLAPENCIAIEDSYNGLRSAYRAGTAAIMVPDQDEPDDEMWGIIAGRAESLADVIDIIENRFE